MTADGSGPRRNPVPGGAGMSGYGGAFGIYYRLGWPSVLLLPAYAKEPPPGLQRPQRYDPSYVDMCAWATRATAGNWPCGYPTRDAESMSKPRQQDPRGRLAEAEKRWGPLSPSYRSSSRTDGVSGIKLFKGPPGTILRDHIAFAELGYRRRRYRPAPSPLRAGLAVAAPGGAPDYQWIAELDRYVCDIPPRPADLAELPAAWLEDLRVTNNGAGLGDGGGEGCDFSAAFAAGGRRSPRPWRERLLEGAR